MQIFGIDLWRIILIVVLIAIVIKRADICAVFAKMKYSGAKYEQSMKIFKVADKIGNLSVGNKMLLGYVCLRCGDLESAKKALDVCIAITRRDTADRYKSESQMALVEWKSGNIDKAIQRMEYVVDDGYKTTLTYQNLGLLYILSGNKEKAMKFNLEAYEYNKEDNIITDNMAQAYALCGEYEKAAEIYEELMNRKNPPRFPEAYYGYGEVLAALGDYTRAAEYVNKALDKPYSFLSVRQKDEVEQLYKDFCAKI